MLFDAHCHLESAADLEQSRQDGVAGWLCAGWSPESWERQVDLPVDHAYGIHPWCAAEVDLDLVLPRLKELLKGAAALGEIGLDRSRRHSAGFARQQELFRLQLGLARERDLPVVLHVVRCPGKTLEILRADGLAAAGGLVHGFAGPPELIAEYEKLGLYLSLGWRGAALGPAVADDRLLLESEGAASLREVLANVARSRQESPGRTEELSWRNAQRLLGRGD